MLIVLLDADVLIDLHRFGIWESLLKKKQNSYPSNRNIMKIILKNTWTNEILKPSSTSLFMLKRKMRI